MTIHEARIIDGVSDKTGQMKSKMANSAHSVDLLDVDIIEISHGAVEIDLKSDILSSFKPGQPMKNLPTLLLYDEKGLQIFEEITYLEEYYLTNTEIELLTRSATEIAQHIQPGSMIVELGSGNLRKVKILLDALEAAGKDIDYYALDLSISELKRTLGLLPYWKHITSHGLHGTYDDGAAWLKSDEVASRQKYILSLGSSIGNFTRSEASGFLKSFSESLSPSDHILIGLDGCDDPSKVYHAYNDREGITHQFILNGLVHANRVLNQSVFLIDDWEVIGEYAFDGEGGRHQAFLSPKKDVEACNVLIKRGERIQIEQSLKYSPREAQSLWVQAGLVEVSKWSASNMNYNIHLLTKQEMAFQLDPAQYASSAVPSVADWRGLWAKWDTVTRGMISDEELLDKPIKLRNACIFYLGHIPTFLDIQLSKAMNESLCEPTYYPRIFERGIDPDVDNPENCHVHSEIPDEWPPLDEILRYQAQVRRKVENLYAVDSKKVSRKVGRSLWLGFEHEVMHLETLLYMLLQSDKTIAPPRTVRPNFEKDSQAAENAAVANLWFTVPEQELTLGLDDLEDNSGPDGYFGWDNEKPPRRVTVLSFQAQARAITNEEYAQYMVETERTSIPASWAREEGRNWLTNARTNGYVNGHSNGHTNGSMDHVSNGATVRLREAFMNNVTVRTVYGLVPLRLALHWPVSASYDELSDCAAWLGGRIPTVEEARSIYSHVDRMRLAQAEKKLGRTVPAVNGHLVNDGVEETPPSHRQQIAQGSSELFANLERANVGFQHWHPVAITGAGNTLAGQSEMGGLWEWTSSPLEKTEGFEPMPLYPAYTADFFDGKHNIVLGGSWATHPRIAGRKTFVNWYQRNYPYVWAGARIVRDL